MPNPQEYAFDVILLWILPFWIFLFNETILLNAPQLPSMTFTASMFRDMIVGIILISLVIVVFALLVYLIYIHRQAGKLIEKGMLSAPYTFRQVLCRLCTWPFPIPSYGPHRPYASLYHGPSPPIRHITPNKTINAMSSRGPWSHTPRNVLSSHGHHV